ncbi:MAG: aspartate/glutamate racemase family protein [Aliiglaciecola sp.]|uniref:aspartate/glutamate racemase family protein n=1 Tax=Aliiglaciecola sp. M165 TaxID=2593649 RepID=UPI00117F63AB|nr:aspartate/glutamate racemase family protein [Aliiglaciecola sp. M165]TRY32644.1 aspartate/glutamate racemase family protein [Aliiglaciecola sp. M165]
MRTLGLIGGMSWESTVTYYQRMNQQIKAKLGGLHSAKVVLHSVDFAQIEKLQHQGQWQALGEILAKAAAGLESAGADCILICTNTMHKVAEQVQQAVSIPLIHIADATADALRHQNISRVALLGTRFTMEQDFYAGRLNQQHDIQVLTPNQAQRDKIHQVIYQELCVGQIQPESKLFYLQVIKELHKQGAQGVILGCTEIGLLVKQQDTTIPLFDTTLIHADTAVAFALK